MHQRESPRGYLQRSRHNQVHNLQVNHQVSLQISPPENRPVIPRCNPVQHHLDNPAKILLLNPLASPLVTLPANLAQGHPCSPPVYPLVILLYNLALNLLGNLAVIRRLGHRVNLLLNHQVIRPPCRPASRLFHLRQVHQHCPVLTPQATHQVSLQISPPENRPVIPRCNPMQHHLDNPAKILLLSPLASPLVTLPANLAQGHPCSPPVYHLVILLYNLALNLLGNLAVIRRFGHRVNLLLNHQVSRPPCRPASRLFHLRQVHQHCPVLTPQATHQVSLQISPPENRPVIPRCNPMQHHLDNPAKILLLSPLASPLVTLPANLAQGHPCSPPVYHLVILLYNLALNLLGNLAVIRRLGHRVNLLLNHQVSRPPCLPASRLFHQRQVHQHSLVLTRVHNPPLNLPLYPPANLQVIRLAYPQINLPTNRPPNPASNRQINPLVDLLGNPPISHLSSHKVNHQDSLPINRLDNQLTNHL